jgi:hypothetical protein
MRNSWAIARVTVDWPTQFGVRDEEDALTLGHGALLALPLKEVNIVYLKAVFVKE